MSAIAVCVCTFERPSQLNRLLGALADLPRPDGTSFVIVDSAGRNTRTEELVAAFRHRIRADVEYVVASRAGISAARNAALAAARHAGATSVAMLDDDEWPSRNWLMKLIETQLATGADVVGGPVRPIFARQPPTREDLWSVRRGTLNGRVHVYCTCNCLFNLAAADFLGPAPFAEEFGRTGGEDVVFFRRLHFAGVSMAWSDEAIVFEDVPAERATFAWMRRRWYRHGNVGVQCEKAAPDPHGRSPLLKTFALCGRLPFYPLFDRRALRTPEIWILEFEKIRGRIASHMGRVRASYGGPESACGSVLHGTPRE